MAETPDWTYSVPRHAEAERIITALCGGSPPANACFAALDAHGWNALEAIAVRTRTANLLHRHIADNRLGVPALIGARLGDLYRRQSLYGLEQRLVLGRVAELLDSRGIANVALKGAALAFTVYPQPAMRPLRDIDVLVPSDRAAEAHYLLQQNGFSRAPWAKEYGTEFNHQLPELVSDRHNVTVEIHHRIYSRGWEGDAAICAMLMETAQSVTAGGKTCHLSAPLANLMHLTVHATLHNCFDNGPLTISDVHRLWHHPDLDRHLAVEMADRLSLGRPLALLLAIARTAGPLSLPPWLEARIENAKAFVPTAMEAMFQIPAEVEQRALFRRLNIEQAGTGPLAAMAKMLQPDPQKLAEIAGSSSNDHRRWSAYPAWAWRRGRNYLAAAGNRDLRAAADRDARMLAWLRKND
ncbi:nucleotidyltransferase family protein [Croceicoccus sp. Ery15]|uniref:nucleotidyltransferase family protein n=1 Tax=Croceicoccus sp. Ery15 TaxID=1703338 RepID=UPI001E40C7DB|nr:nucleotidyltransferase family protein [Croceicoccus sp. Ery15]